MISSLIITLCIFIGVYAIFLIYDFILDVKKLVKRYKDDVNHQSIQNPPTRLYVRKKVIRSNDEWEDISDEMKDIIKK